MNHTYVSSGTIRVAGCASLVLYHFFFAKYSVGDIVYSGPKARKGILEKYCIKEIRFFTKAEEPVGLCRYCSFPPLYVDTLNAFHNEEDLVSPQVARVLVDNYIEFKKAQLQEFKLRSC